MAEIRCPGCGSVEAESCWKLHPRRFARALVAPRDGHRPGCTKSGMHLLIRCAACQFEFCADIPGDVAVEKQAGA